MKNKLLISINNLEDIKDYRRVGVTAFLFPVSNYSVGYPNTFDLNEIPDDNSYILINKILDCKMTDNLKLLLKEIPSYIKGIIFDDIAVFNIAKELDLKQELIWYQKHFGTNSEIINYYLDKGIHSAFISNEITKEEILKILENVNKSLILQIFGYNQIMYSRRALLTNYTEYFKLEKTKEMVISEKKANIKFKIYEDDNGTVIFNNKIYNGLELISFPNVKYFYINTAFLDKKSILNLIQNIDNPQLEMTCDNGFLDKKTIYKISESVGVK